MSSSSSLIAFHFAMIEQLRFEWILIVKCYWWGLLFIYLFYLLTLKCIILFACLFNFIWINVICEESWSNLSFNLYINITSRCSEHDATYVRCSFSLFFRVQNKLWLWTKTSEYCCCSMKRVSLCCLHDHFSYMILCGMWLWSDLSSSLWNPSS